MGRRAGLDGRKISSALGFDPRTVQPVSQSLYRLSYPAHIYVYIYICIYIYICQKNAYFYDTARLMHCSGKLVIGHVVSHFQSTPTHSVAKYSILILYFPLHTIP